MGIDMQLPWHQAAELAMEIYFGQIHYQCLNCGGGSTVMLLTFPEETVVNSKTGSTWTTHKRRMFEVCWTCGHVIESELPGFPGFSKETL